VDAHEAERRAEGAALGRGGVGGLRVLRVALGGAASGVGSDGAVHLDGLDAAIELAEAARDEQPGVGARDELVGCTQIVEGLGVALGEELGAALLEEALGLFAVRVVGIGVRRRRDEREGEREGRGERRFIGTVLIGGSS
jgi:hypothetical protein